MLNYENHALLFRDVMPEIIDTVDCGVIVVDVDFKIVFFNKWIATTSGLSLEDVRHKRIEILIRGESNTRLSQAIELATQHRQSSIISQTLNRLPLALYESAEDRMKDVRIKQGIVVKPLLDGLCVIQVSDYSASSKREEILRKQAHEYQDMADLKSKAEAEVKALLHSVLDGVLVLGSNRVLKDYNKSVLSILGYGNSEFSKMSLSTIFPELEGFLDAFRRDDVKNMVETFAITKSQSQIPVELSVGYTQEAEDEAQIIVIFRDISERKSVEKQIKTEKEVAQVTLRSITNGVIATDAEGVVSSFNRVAEQLTGWTEEEAIGKHVKDVIYSCSDLSASDFDRMLDASLSGECIRSPHTNGIAIIRSGAQETINEFVISPITMNNQATVGAVIVFHDVTQTNQMAEKLSWQTYHDPLTELPNRRRFEGEIIDLLSDVNSDSPPSCILYGDLDQFKVINDTCGHHAGDILLKALVPVLKSCCRDSDLIARLGGDEFGIILENCPTEKAQVVAENLRRAVEEFRFEWEDKVYPIGISIGLVDISEETSLMDLLGAADAACYSAKQKGRNRVYIHDYKDDSVTMLRSEVRWAAEIPSAISEERLFLVKQDILSLKSNAVEHCEVLMRIGTPDQKTYPPGAFLPAAERFNYMFLVDKYITQKALNYIRQDESGFGQFNINLSGSSVGDEKFLNFVLEELRGNQQLASRVCFEITETAAIVNMVTAINFIKSIRMLGCKFALDDFGSGLSSFAYLKNLPVDYLKIDGQFIKNITKDNIDHAMVNSINEIGHKMNLRTVAEFVEDQKTLDALRALNIDYAQGYFIHKPERLC